MDFGAPKKSEFALQITAALGYIALVNYDRVQVQPYAEALATPLPMQRGRNGVIPFLNYLGNLESAGKTAFSASLKRFAASTRKKGIAIVVSDFFDSEWQEGVKALLARGFQVALVQVLAPEELKPTLKGDLRVIDSETGNSQEMSINPALLARYEQRLTEFTQEIENFSRRYGIDYFRTSSDAPFEEVVLKYLRESGLVK